MSRVRPSIPCAVTGGYACGHAAVGVGQMTMTPFTTGRSTARFSRPAGSQHDTSGSASTGPLFQGPPPGTSRCHPRGSQCRRAAGGEIARVASPPAAPRQCAMLGTASGPRGVSTGTSQSDRRKKLQISSHSSVGTLHQARTRFPHISTTLRWPRTPAWNRKCRGPVQCPMAS